jgi:hypothetical protein
MTRRHASGTFTITGVGQSTLNLEGISIPLTGEARLDGIVRQGAVVTVKIPNSLVDVLLRALDRPIEQIPMYRMGLVALSISKP